MRITLKDVAATAGVSVSTVSQVLRETGNTWISESTKERVREVALALGYRANPAARLLASQKGHYFAIVVRQVRGMIMLDPIRTVARQALKAGYTPFVIETINLPLSHNDNIESLADAVVFVCGTNDKEFCKRIDQFHSNVATVVATSPLNSRFPEFVWDEAKGFELILDHLTEQGHTQLALLGGAVDGNPVRQRQYIEACEMHNIKPLIVSSQKESDTIQTGRQMAKQLLEKLPNVTAVIGRNLEFTIGALAEFQHQGLHIPTDMSLVAFTNSPLADGIWPRLTALKTPINEAALKAANTAIRMLQGQKIKNTQEIFPITLIRGETTSEPRKGSHKLLPRA